jgi:AcrR family transcriptional regulator
MSATGMPAQEAERPRAMRADAQRNYQRLLSAANEAFADHGADDASLEEIARRAGVGIGTLYRHFPTRQALLEAVYRDQVEALRVRAVDLLQSGAPGEALAIAPDEALAIWLRALVDFGRTKRSLASALLATLDKESELLSSSGAVMRESATALLTRAQQAGLVRADASASDLLRLVHAISMAIERPPADDGQAGRLLGLVVDGLRPQPPG